MSGTSAFHVVGGLVYKVGFRKEDGSWIEMEYNDSRDFVTNYFRRFPAALRTAALNRPASQDDDPSQQPPNKKPITMGFEDSSAFVMNFMKHPIPSCDKDAQPEHCVFVNTKLSQEMIDGFQIEVDKRYGDVSAEDFVALLARHAAEI